MQDTNLLLNFGKDHTERMQRALEALRAGGGVVVVDDESRENEGDIIYPAETITESQMALMIRRCSGIVCLTLTQADCDRLDLPQMVEKNTNTQGTAFCVTIEAAQGVTTGVSAHDRVATIRAAVRPGAKPEDLRRPGHVYPIRARDGGVLTRRGHTESSVDLMQLAGYRPFGVLCELMNDDGTMMRLPELCRFAKEEGFTLISVEDIARYRRDTGL